MGGPKDVSEVVYKRWVYQRGGVSEQVDQWRCEEVYALTEVPAEEAQEVFSQ